ncbi:hypothetical protein [Pelosinus propionicus]|uniref:Uncharacterized protein n=1 Tax=Pelosinus propionicus DSM 13327 TaxID=1123291 RepID=A0A1I4LIV1_9FIRM|nr:hypothetical protein [Pelosinus propionicus]SFL90756.1 hypothetical protein SAMN04490355_10257 [Pelosinus propionicus DSM 13327]
MEIEDRSTWPRNFLEIATQKKQLIIAYHKFKKDIEFRSIKNVELRYNPPLNPFKAEYQEVIWQTEKLLKPNNFVAYHCTKLIDYEIENIKRNGMKILSKELVQERLISAHQHGYLLKEEFDYLINSQDINEILHNKHGVRTERICFFANCSLLRNDINGIYRFFRSWGGEGVYWGHENDKNIALTLKKLGTPCILICSIPVNDIEHYSSSLAERFFSNLIASDIENPEPPSVFEMYIRRNLDASEIIEVVELQTPKFCELTDYNNWDKYYKDD